MEVGLLCFDRVAEGDFKLLTLYILRDRTQGHAQLCVLCAALGGWGNWLSLRILGFLVDLISCSSGWPHTQEYMGAQTGICVVCVCVSLCLYVCRGRVGGWGAKQS